MTDDIRNTWGDPLIRLKKPKAIMIRNRGGDVPATLDFVNYEMKFWVATVEGPGLVAKRRVFLLDPVDWYDA